MLTVIRRVVVRTQSKRREAKEQGLAMSERRSCFGPKRKEKETVCVLETVPLPLLLPCAQQAAGIRLVPLFLDPGKWVPWIMGVSVQSQC